MKILLFLAFLLIGFVAVTADKVEGTKAPPGIEQLTFATVDASVQISDIIISPEESMYTESPVNHYNNPNNPEGVELWLGPAELTESKFVYILAADNQTDGTIETYQVFTSSGGMANWQSLI
jgi:hypothetical protein